MKHIPLRVVDKILFIGRAVLMLNTSVLCNKNVCKDDNINVIDMKYDNEIVDNGQHEQSYISEYEMAGFSRLFHSLKSELKNGKEFSLLRCESTLDGIKTVISTKLWYDVEKKSILKFYFVFHRSLLVDCHQLKQHFQVCAYHTILNYCLCLQ